MKSGRILIVDDDYDIRISLRDLLEEENYEVLTATQGQDALTQLSQCSQLPDLIVLDLMMPVMNGWDFMKAFRAIDTYAPIPVIVASAAEKPRPADGAQGFVKKPIDIVAFLELIAQLKN